MLPRPEEKWPDSSTSSNAPTAAASSAPPTSARRSSCSAGSRSAATTAAASSSTSATATASPRSSSIPTSTRPAAIDADQRVAYERTSWPTRRAASGSSASAASSSSRGANKNPKLPTGEIEVHVVEATVFNKADTPPFEIADDIDTGEEKRLQYRYLDLRRAPLQQTLRMRHQINQSDAQLPRRRRASSSSRRRSW